MRLIGLEAENVKRLRAVEITFKDGLTVIGGKNDNGKSSTLDAIAMALGGKALMPSKPVRRGQKSGHAKVTIGQDDIEYTITRRFSAKGTTSLTIEDAKGESKSSPQAFLDKILGVLSFDPLAFSRMSEKDQEETLRKLVGLDTSELDAEIRSVFDDRTTVGREKKRLEARLEGMTKHDVPDEPVDVSALAERIRKSDDATRSIEVCDRTVESNNIAIDGLRRDIEHAEKKIRDYESNNNALLKQVEGLTPEPVEPLRAQLKNAQEDNRKVLENKAYQDVEKALAEEEKDYKALDRTLQELREKRESMIATSQFPVEGLEISPDGDGVLFNGLPLDQEGDARKLAISVSIGLAMNPDLKLLLVKDGSLLDDDSLALVAKMADDAGAQVLMERVGVDEHTAIVIEDGSVADVDLERNK